jgi:hypothetical protein
LLVFVHIPKTGGTTVRTVLAMNEPGERNRPLSNVFKGGGGLDKSLIEHLRNGKDLRLLNVPSLKATRVLRGHFPLGIREYLSRYVPKGREVLYFTFLRDPVDRSLSHYFQIREGRDGYGSEEFALSRLPADPTLDDMLKGGYIHDNLQTRMLSGLPEPFGKVTDQMLEQAKKSLREALVFFGLAERFDESLVTAKQRLGLSSILYKAEDRLNPDRPRGTEIPDDLVQAAERCNRYDIELYRYAEELFDSAPERGGLDFEVELAALRAAKAEGEIAAETPAPPVFEGVREEWQMLLQARATLLRLEWEQARNRIRVATTGGPKVLLNELKAANSRTKELEEEVERLQAASSTPEEREVNRPQAAAGSRPKRDSRRRNPKVGRSRPKRDSKRGRSKRTGRSERASGERRAEPHQEAGSDGG